MSISYSGGGNADDYDFTLEEPGLDLVPKNLGERCLMKNDSGTLIPTDKGLHVSPDNRYPYDG